MQKLKNKDAHCSKGCSQEISTAQRYIYMCIRMHTTRVFAYRPGVLTSPGGFCISRFMFIPTLSITFTRVGNGSRTVDEIFNDQQLYVIIVLLTTKTFRSRKISTNDSLKKMRTRIEYVSCIQGHWNNAPYASERHQVRNVK